MAKMRTLNILVRHLFKCPISLTFVVIKNLIVNKKPYFRRIIVIIKKLILINYPISLSLVIIITLLLKLTTLFSSHQSL